MTDPADAPGASVSIGVAGSLGPAAITTIAAAVEAAGFHALWVNDTPGTDSLAAIAAAATATDRLVLATGVVPVDRRPADEILAAVRDLPQHRLVLGVGSGGARIGAIDLVRSAVARLRAETDAVVMVGALGPRMRRLAAEDADGVLLSWLTPARAAEQAAEARAISPSTNVSLYVRTALQPAAAERLAKETAQYASFPAYGANLRRLGIAAADTTLDDAGFEEGLRDDRAAVDEVVLRAITPSGSLADILGFVELAAARIAAI